MQANINPELAGLTRPIKGLTHYDGNARTHNIQVIAASLKTNGQYRPLVVRKDGDPKRNDVVLAGNGTLEAARDILDWDEIACTYVECDDATARRIVLVDNRANDLGGYDETALAALLAELDDFTGTGYVQSDLDDLLERVGGELPDVGSGGLGEAVIQYTIIFDTEEQQAAWFDFVKALRTLYPDADSIAERIVTWIADHGTDG